MAEWEEGLSVNRSNELSLKQGELSGIDPQREKTQSETDELPPFEWVQPPKDVIRKLLAQAVVTIFKRRPADLERWLEHATQRWVDTVNARQRDGSIPRSKPGTAIPDPKDAEWAAHLHAAIDLVAPEGSALRDEIDEEVFLLAVRWNQKRYLDGVFDILAADGTIERYVDENGVDCIRPIEEKGGEA